ncbi:MAG: CRISPR-associated helicase Cas3' [Chloroflexota bacterium]|nr:CRISPR-associated helicase Cas3' [Chloroflexota bacterium]
MSNDELPTTGRPRYLDQFWAKARPQRARGPERIHLLEHHLADVGACLEALLRQPTIRRRLARTAGLTDLDAATTARLCVFAALHDIGKVNLGFQAQVWRDADLSNLRPRRAGHTLDLAPVLIGDDADSALWFFDALGWDELTQWDARDGEVVSDLLVAALSHHGLPLQLEGERQRNPTIWRPLGRLDPEQYTRRIGSLLKEWFPAAWDRAAAPLPEATAFQHMFLGLCTLADWIGSNEGWFPFDDEPTDGYISRARAQAQAAIAETGLDISEQRLAVHDRDALPGFAELFRIVDGSANAIQRQAALGTALQERLIVIESETGSGKTEAALWRFLRMYEAELVDGLYFALPTRSAATQIHGRVRRFVDSAFPDGHRPDVVLAVPGYSHEAGDGRERLQDYRVWWDQALDDALPGRRWAAERPKRYLAAQIAVGTIDQAMLAALKVKHSHMRAACLARNLLIVDEVHASDSYMGAILRALLEAHLGAGGYAVLMSATLGSTARRSWLTAGATPGASDLPLEEAIRAPYPAVSVPWDSSEEVLGVGENGREKTVRIDTQPLMEQFERVAQLSLDAASVGAKVLLVRNTVDYAVRTQQAVENAASGQAESPLFSCGGTVTLHHGRFVPGDRALLDREVEARLGRVRSQGGVIVVGTQTLEQSLDIDADLLITDLCPLDVLLQRIGRLHRHPRDDRPAAQRRPACVVLTPGTCNLSPLLKRGVNGLGQYVYEDLRILEATRRLVVRHPEWTIPRMNRELVERATHPEALEALVAELGDDWRTHANQLEGGTLAEGLSARNVVVRREAAFCRDNREVLFGSLEERIRTRLGDEAIEFDLDPPQRSPFDSGPIAHISVPRRWLGDSWADAPASADPDADGFTFRVANRIFRYDRFGLRREPASQ